MAELKKYNLKGNAMKGEQIDDTLLVESVHSQLVKEYIVALRENARQWSANTRGRSEIACSGKKPHPQKGTGRARQGSLVTPQFRGGAVVFGPKPKFNQHVRINRKERRQAIRHLLTLKIKEGNVQLLELGKLEAPKTKLVAEFLKGAGIEGKSILFLGDSDSSTKANTGIFVKSARNINRTRFMPAESISGYDIARTQKIVIVGSALDKFKALFGSEEKQG